MPLLGTFGGGSARGFGRGLATSGGAATKVGVFYSDSNAANLWAAVPLTNYQSGTTGGGFIDVSTQIRSAMGLTAGTAKSYNQGTAAINTTTTVAPFAWYTNSLLFPSSYGATTDLTYTSSTLGSNQAMTVECRIYVPNTNIYPAILATNPLGSGGYYCCWTIGVGYPGYQDINYFSNYGSPSGRVTSSGTSLTLNAWNHVAFVFNGSTNLKMFINGTKCYDGDYGENASGSGPTTIGPTNWDGYGNSSGVKMVDYRIYTGVQKYSASFTVSDTNPDLGGAILAA